MTALEEQVAVFSVAVGYELGLRGEALVALRKGEDLDELMTQIREVAQAFVKGSESNEATALAAVQSPIYNPDVVRAFLKIQPLIQPVEL
jgi:hypothetical protein